MATVPNFRAHGFTVVIHNVFNEPEYWTPIIDSMGYDRRVLSFEPYGDRQEGFHLHIFTDHCNAVRSGKFFKLLMKAKEGHCQTENGMGRLEIDTRHGTFEQATAYLTQSETKKEKVCGTPLVRNKHIATCMDCGLQDQKFYMGHSYMNGQHRCKKCASLFELKEVYSRAYGSALDFKNALDDFENGFFCFDPSKSIKDFSLGV